MLIDTRGGSFLPDPTTCIPASARRPAKHGTLSEYVYEAVKELIIAGELGGGELTSEGAVAERTGTSRTPVREAFLRLEAEGWLTLYPKRGALVNAIPPDEPEHLVEARLLIESGCLRSFTADTRRRTGAADEMLAILERQRRLAAEDDRGAFSAEDADFHAVVVRYSGNPLLTSVHTALRDRQRRMTAISVSRDPSQLNRIITDHAELTEHVRAGEVDQFSILLDTHMREVHQLTGCPWIGNPAILRLTHDPR
ncbi:GntR family transcriptional regulator (plasmid) [Rhodococcus pseudokoreensis]|uniref:GntR family transcriptional regulator n=2 Tax=Rhodococcus pseudokoreensis TaxID=2811421 RepID=A0A974VZ15_9NOCA|nr:GntR family transcriptional regulator [Rhodococcus pseudokoreensis]